MRFWHWVVIALIGGGIYIYTQKPEVVANVIQEISDAISPPPPKTAVTQPASPTVDLNAGPHDLQEPASPALHVDTNQDSP